MKEMILDGEMAITDAAGRTDFQALRNYLKDPQAKNPEKEKNFPIIYDIYDAYRQAGKELATKGLITPATQKQANRLIMKIPFFAKYLMKFKPFQEEAKKKHALMIESAIHR